MRGALPLLAVLVACGDRGSTTGRERGACHDDGTCEAGLACQAGVCARPPGADCEAVGARLARVGPEPATPARVRALAEACARARLTRAEGACLLAAADDDALGRCPRALLPALDGDRRGCARLAAHVTELTRRELAQGGRLRTLLGPVIDELAPVVTDSCVDDRWGEPAKACLQAATGYADGQACLAQLDPDDRRAIERRITMLVKLGMARPSRP